MSTERIDHVLEAVSAAFGVDKVRDGRRTKTRAAARAAACYLLRHRFDMSLPEIGRAMGLDHSTVWYHVRAVSQWDSASVKAIRLQQAEAAIVATCPQA